MPASQPAARPSTAPDPSMNLNRTSARRTKPHKSIATSTEEVNKLFITTTASFHERVGYDNEIFTILNKYNELEQEAIKRNFLHFADVPDVPRHSKRSAEFRAKLSRMVEEADISIEKTAAAVKALKQGGVSGPKKRSKGEDEKEN